MVAEVRASRLDLAARAKFARDGEEIMESRAALAEIIEDLARTDEERQTEFVRRTAESLYVAAGGLDVEVG